MTRRVVLALGSNLGDRAALLRAAVAALGSAPEVGRVVAVSRVYETEPVGGPDDQGPYLNLAVALDSDAAPRALLSLCARLEAAAGRVRVVRWGPRTLDVDIVWIDGTTVDEEDLQVPHPRFRERAFVLAPLEEVAPDLVPQGWRDALVDQNAWPVGSLDEVGAG